MPTYLERYQSGEYEQVWHELVAHGSAIRQEPLYGEAQAVAHAMMTRARHNIELIITRLHHLGYQFNADQPHRPFNLDIGQMMQNISAQIPPDVKDLERDQPPGTPSFSQMFGQLQEVMTRHLAPMMEELQQLTSQWQSAAPPPPKTPGQLTGWMPPDENLLHDIAELERDYGPLPLVLRTWYELVGQVDLIGDHPKLSCYNHHDAGPMSDPLVVVYDGDTFRDLIEGEDDEEDADELPLPPGRRLAAFEIAPDACHKSNFSGGGCSYFKAPNPCFDGPLVSEDQWDRMFFVPYLRECFAWGGFPGLKSDPEAAEAAREELAFLTQDLLPI